jgi:mRNA-degrading endonuclease RelE of RelBE toxin-antitoxin system
MDERALGFLQGKPRRMTYEVVFSATAERETEELLEYLSRYDENISEQYELSLSRIGEFELATISHSYFWFWLTGPPYRGRLFTVSRHTAFWLVYTVDDEKRVLAVRRFWNASRDPSKLKL